MPPSTRLRRRPARRQGGGRGFLARMLRKHPVDFTARDFNGTLRNVHVDEVTLINIATADILNPGQLAAASDALEAGDEQPLVRLAAELFFEGGEPDDPALLLRRRQRRRLFCNDADFVWQRGDPIGVRRAKYARALDGLGRHRFAPFSKQAWATYWTGLLPSLAGARPIHPRRTPGRQGHGRPDAAHRRRARHQRAIRDDPQPRAGVPGSDVRQLRRSAPPAVELESSARGRSHSTSSQRSIQVTPVARRSRHSSRRRHRSSR